MSQETRRTLYNEKRINQQEDITVINIYELSIKAPKYIYKKKPLADLKGEIDSNKIIAGDFKTLFSIIDKSSR